jgi:hypothetical protein
MDAQLPTGCFDTDQLRQKIETLSPDVVAFNGKKAAAIFSASRAQSSNMGDSRIALEERRSTSAHKHLQPMRTGLNKRPLSARIPSRRLGWGVAPARCPPPEGGTARALGCYWYARRHLPSGPPSPERDRSGITKSPLPTSRRVSEQSSMKCSPRCCLLYFWSHRGWVLRLCRVQSIKQFSRQSHGSRPLPFTYPGFPKRTKLSLNPPDLSPGGYEKRRLSLRLLQHDGFHSEGRSLLPTVCLQ